MSDYQKYFNWTNVSIEHFYAYLVVAACVAAYIVLKSRSKYKFELFFLSFYLMTGNISDLLIVKIPGFSFFEIQPTRFIYLLLGVFVIRKTVLSRKRFNFSLDTKVPWFMLALLAYVFMIILSMVVHFSQMGTDGLLVIIEAMAFLIFVFGLQQMADKPTYDVIGYSFIIGAIASSIISLVQLGIDPYFLRIGEDRAAFGDFIRSNGIFGAEYYNSYFLIIAVAWTLIKMNENRLKWVLVVLFSLGVITSFQRMSWIVLTMVLSMYLIYVKRVSFDRLAVGFLTGLAVIVSIFLFYFQDIMHSTLVKERLSDSVDSRKGYYKMVLENVGKKPIFGYGDRNNSVYYENMLRITRSRERATGEQGGFHSGYFASLFLYGVPGFVFFTLFVFLAMLYYGEALRYNNYFVIPFLVGILYAVGNLTNSFLFLNYVATLYAIHIGIGLGIGRIENRKSNQNLQD